VNDHAMNATLALPGSETDPSAALILCLNLFPTEPPADLPRPPLAGSRRPSNRNLPATKPACVAPRASTLNSQEER
jgi:hypothetical protein